MALIQENLLIAYKYLFMNCVYCWREREREREREMLDLLNEELALGLDSVYKWNLILGENGQMPFSKKKKKSSILPHFPN